LEKLQSKVDFILVGGKLSIELKDHPIVNRKVVLGKLNKTGKDINRDTIDQFFRFIAMAGTVIWNGPMGKYEDKANRQGTAAIARQLAQARAFTVVGGGDTEAALTTIGIRKGIDFISSGGGAMLDYLTFGTLPGIEAVEKSAKVA
jgi:phosphoglycerate kinase